MIKENIISIQQKRMLKLKAAARDNFKTPEGKQIELSKLNDGKSYHKGHVDPYADT